jgi:hypothetical protein
VETTAREQKSANRRLRRSETNEAFRLLCQHHNAETCLSLRRGSSDERASGVLRQSEADLTQVGRATKELGVQVIVDSSSGTRGWSEPSLIELRRRLPPELRPAWIVSLEKANRFLREHYVAEFNAKFSLPAAQRGTAFRPFNAMKMTQSGGARMARPGSTSHRPHRWRVA